MSNKVDPKDIFLPPLHIKLRLIKTLVKAMGKTNSNGFQYLKEICTKIKAAKLKESTFIGPQIRELIKDNDFILSGAMNFKFLRNLSKMRKFAKYNTKKCCGRLHSSGQSVVHTTEHNHVADIAKVEAKEAMARLKNIAKTTELSTHAVLRTLTSQFMILDHFQHNWTISEYNRIKTQFNELEK
ncbi:FLYWCH-type zinc finger-containing protein 1 [Aphis craccivora]|uniref:FLYWCH-type zinc finger-containing protein 1 n=1 Tax=Aphis craccivora TaxID=307492 RepID=A0A6G0YF11_APHCR|nr:FLYWCH-type zinc finger-containing protein 1 [Aphis craccivora]